MVFEKFDNRRKHNNSSLLYIRKGGTIGISTYAYRGFGLSEFQSIILHFDREKNIIGLQPINTIDDSAAIPMHKRYGSVSLCAKSFLVYFKIPHNKTTRYKLTKDPETGFFVADISEGE